MEKFKIFIFFWAIFIFNFFFIFNCYASLGHKYALSTKIWNHFGGSRVVHLEMFQKKSILGQKWQFLALKPKKSYMYDQRSTWILCWWWCSVQSVTQNFLFWKKNAHSDTQKLTTFKRKPLIIELFWIKSIVIFM